MQQLLHHFWSVTVCRRCIGCHDLQVSFRETATNNRALLWKKTYKDKAVNASLPPCTVCSPLQGSYVDMYTYVYIYRHSLTSTCSIYIDIDTEIDEYIHEEKGNSNTIEMPLYHPVQCVLQGSYVEVSYSKSCCIAFLLSLSSCFFPQKSPVISGSSAGVLC